MLLYCNKLSAFPFISQMLANQMDIAYKDLAELINERFSGADYRTKLETKLRGMMFKEGVNINEFSNELRLTVKDFLPSR